MVRRRVCAVSNHEAEISPILRDARKSVLLRVCESIDFGIFDMSQIKDLEPTKTSKLE